MRIGIAENRVLQDSTLTDVFSYQMYSLLYLMTRWGLVADVWYLPPRKKRPGQSAVEFAEQVKAEISQTANLKNLQWDGYWKNYIPPPEKQDKLKEDPRNRYAAILVQRSETESSRSVKRRFSFDADGSLPFGMEEEFVDEQTVDTTSIRNQVLVNLQEHERKDLMTSLKEKRYDVVNTWKVASKQQKTGTSSISPGFEQIDARRLENISWRLWFRERIYFENYRDMKSRERDSFSPSGVLEVFTNLLPFPNRLFSPQDLYSHDMASIEDSLKSPSTKALIWKESSDENDDDNEE